MPPRIGWRAAAARFRTMVRPPVTIDPPPPDVTREIDVEVPARDGTILRVNVHRPARGAGPWPVLVCAHPYGKDDVPAASRSGAKVPLQFHMLRTPPLRISAWTGWESPDPGFWVPRGYVLVVADLRGFHRSDGVPTLLSAQEGDDYHDLIEWAGTQPWSNGKVGLNGVSYLAITQWEAAATRPPHLAAICPWEGFTDVYRDFVRPGGIAENGFVRIWSAMVRRGARDAPDLRAEQQRRPVWDDWWAARVPDLARIDVPALVCASFSDQNLHTRGSFHGFTHIASTQKWLYTHRGGKWSTYYSPAALAVQARFFDHFLKGDDNGQETVPPVRVEVRAARDEIAEVLETDAWPPAAVTWTTWHLDAAGRALLAAPPDAVGEVAFDARRGRATFRHAFATRTDVIGPMAVRLWLEARGRDDVDVFVGIRKFRADGTPVPFEGSYGYAFDIVAHGGLRASLRATDPAQAEGVVPWHPYTERQPLRAGEIVPLDIEILPSATRFEPGEVLRLDVQGRWFFPRNPITGQFPAGYDRSPRGTVVLHTGADHPATLTLPLRQGA